MSVKLFILGRPGTGKSTAYRYIREFLVKQYNLPIAHYNDYDILQEMFLREKLFPPKKKRFEAKELDGFDVLDFTVLDDVLRIIEKTVRATSSKEKEELIIIEFARQDYNQAFNLFSDSFLRDSYFLFLSADLPICVQRVKDRVTDPPTPDNHFVSEHILTSYYGNQVIPTIIKTQKGMSVDKDRIKLIVNRGDLQEFYHKVENFIHDIITKNSHITQPHPVIRPKQRKNLAGIPQLLFFTLSNHKKPTHLKVQSTKSRSSRQNPQKKHQRKHRSSTSHSLHP